MMANICVTGLAKAIGFYKNSRGQIAIMAAILMVPLSVIIGGSLDVAQKLNAESKLQSTIDSAILAVARGLTIDIGMNKRKMRKIAQTVFDTNISVSDNVDMDKFDLTFNKGQLKMSQTARVNTSFLKLINLANLPINVSATVDLQSSDVELALILDTTLSMVYKWDKRGNMSYYPQKLENLKAAARDLVGTLLAKKSGLVSTRISLVPWSAGVNVTSTRKKVIKQNRKGYHYCAGSRAKAVDVSPLGKKLPYVYAQQIGGRKNEEKCANREIVPLTDNKEKLFKEIAAWQAAARTASDSGLTWGWGTLSPKWNNYWNAKSKPKPYKNNVKKIAILMTDGENSIDHINSDERSLALCTAMKKKGIVIYTIAFEVRIPAAIKMLQSCASSPDMYINADSGDALKAAFKQIASEVGSFHLSS